MKQYAVCVDSVETFKLGKPEDLCERFGEAVSLYIYYIVK